MYKRIKKLKNPDISRMGAVSFFDATGLYQTPPKNRFEEESYAHIVDAVSDIDSDEDDLSDYYGDEYLNFLYKKKFS